MLAKLHQVRARKKCWGCAGSRAAPHSKFLLHQGADARCPHTSALPPPHPPTRLAPVRVRVSRDTQRVAPQAREELRPVRDDFEAKNKQLLDEMPRFYSSRLDYFQPSFESLIRAQVRRLPPLLPRRMAQRCFPWWGGSRGLWTSPAPPHTLEVGLATFSHRPHPPPATPQHCLLEGGIQAPQVVGWNSCFGSSIALWLIPALGRGPLVHESFAHVLPTPAQPQEQEEACSASPSGQGPCMVGSGQDQRPFLRTLHPCPSLSSPFRGRLRSVLTFSKPGQAP